MTRTLGWAIALGLVACTKGGKDDAKVLGAAPPAPNASAQELLPPPAPVPPVTDGKGFTLVYTHNMDGEIEPCG
jgi:hypothetical protein